MNAPVEFSRLGGCCMLDTEGGVGFVGAGGELALDSWLSEALGEHTRSMLAEYLREPGRGPARIGVVYHDDRRPWSAPTLMFSSELVRTLFPVAGSVSSRLTNFQQRNRVRSLYQAFEILLNYRRQSTPGVPLFCPALFDRGTLLADYAHDLPEEIPAARGEIPVIEVLNLLEGMPHRERGTEAVRALLTRVYGGVVRPELRRPPDLELVDDDDEQQADDDGVQIADPYGDVRRRSQAPIDTPRAAQRAPVPPATVHAAAPLAGRGELGPDVLRRFRLFEHLPLPALTELCARTAVRDAAAGTCLIKAGDVDDWNYFLLEGSLGLQAVDGGASVLRAGSDPALNPVARLLPRQYTVTATTPVRYFRIHQSLLRQVAGAEGAAGGRGNVPSPLLEAVQRELAADALELPSLPDVAARVRTAVQNESADARVLTRVIETDPAITAKLIRTANSALYRGSDPVEDLTAAIVRLGLDTTRRLVTTYALREVFDAPPGALRGRMEDLWRHSTLVAALSFALARITPGIDPERALLAGLLHDIGSAAILAYIARHPGISHTGTEIETTLQRLRGEVGAAILKKWQFSEELARVAAEADHWYRDPAAEPDLCDLVLIAQLHSFVGTDRANGAPRMDELPAFDKLALGQLTPALSLEVLHEAQDQIDEAQRLLGG